MILTEGFNSAGHTVSLVIGQGRGEGQRPELEAGGEAVQGPGEMLRMG